MKETQRNGWIKEQVAQNAPDAGMALSSLEAPSGHPRSCSGACGAPSDSHGRLWEVHTSWLIFPLVVVETLTNTCSLRGQIIGTKSRVYS